MKNVFERIAVSCIASNKQIFDYQRDPARWSLSQAEPAAPSNMRLTGENDKKVPTDAERRKQPELTDAADAQYVLGYN